MASSRVMPPPPSSSSSATADLPHQSSIYSPDAKAAALGSVSMDDLFRNYYPAAGEAAPPSLGLPGKSSAAEGEEGSAAAAYGEVSMTLEDFLTRTCAVRPEDVRVPSALGFGIDPVIEGQFGVAHPLAQIPLENPIPGLGNGGEGGGRGRVRKRALMDPADRAALQRQKRMIKNRESAARSRERRQAYTVELETLVTKLEEENAILERELEEHKKKRLEELMESLIPVTEKKKPPRALRRTLSANW